MSAEQDPEPICFFLVPFLLPPRAQGYFPFWFFFFLERKGILGGGILMVYSLINFFPQGYFFIQK